MNRQFFSFIVIVVLFTVSCDNENSSSYWMDEIGQSGQFVGRFDDYGENPFINTTGEPVSTFSVDADGASIA